MIDPKILPVYALIDYAWTSLKANTAMTESNYNGRVPIIPTSQQPEFTDTDKPFIVYGWNETPQGDVSAVRTGQISFAIYSSSDGEIAEISNILVSAFNRFDESAENINRWKVGTPFQPILFMSTWTGVFDGPTPEQREAGRRSAVVLVRFRYTATYDVSLPGSIAP